eukprot:m.10021 g.10021  ORF g.10021 m.10021 type:complete len:585 (+) comp5523_c0_seq1:54-1808(+)
MRAPLLLLFLKLACFASSLSASDSDPLSFPAYHFALENGLLDSLFPLPPLIPGNVSVFVLGNTRNTSEDPTLQTWSITQGCNTVSLAPPKPVFMPIPATAVDLVQDPTGVVWALSVCGDYNKAICLAHASTPSLDVWSGGVQVITSDALAGLTDLTGVRVWSSTVGNTTTYWALVAGCTGAGTPVPETRVLLFQSYDNDISTWHAGSTFFNATLAAPECPRSFSFLLLSSTSAALFYSTQDATTWVHGQLALPTFTPLASGQVFVGHPPTMHTATNALGEHLIHAVVNEERPLSTATWAGVGLLPRVLRFYANKPTQLLFPLSEETALLRTAGPQQYSIDLDGGREVLSALASAGMALELRVRVTYTDQNPGPAALRILTSPDGAESTVIQFSPGPACRAGALLTQTDMPGNDYNSRLMHNATARDCQALCCADPNCFAFTFTDPQPTLGTRESMPSGPLGDGDCVSGKQCCFFKTRAASPVPGCHVCTSGFSNNGFIDVSVNRSTSSLAPGPATSTLALGEMYSALRVFIDHSLVEFDLDDGTVAAATRVYPTRPDATQIILEASSPVHFDVTAWPLSRAACP